MAQSHGENLKQALDTLRAHKMRSALTVFGVVLGVSVIMLVSALITGFDEQIQENIKQYRRRHRFRFPLGSGPARSEPARWKSVCENRSRWRMPKR